MTKRELESLVGKLALVSRAVKPGKGYNYNCLSFILELGNPIGTIT